MVAALLLIVALGAGAGAAAPPSSCGPDPSNGPAVSGSITVWGAPEPPLFPQRFADSAWDRVSAIAANLHVDPPELTICLYVSLPGAAGVDVPAGEIVAVTPEAILVDDGGTDKPRPEELVAAIVREQLAAELVDDPLLATGLGYRADLLGAHGTEGRENVATILEAVGLLADPSEMLADNGASVGPERDVGALMVVESGIEAWGYDSFLERANRGFTEAELDQLDTIYQRRTHRGRVFPVVGTITAAVLLLGSIGLVTALQRRAKRSQM